MANRVICIGRQFGSGGHEIAVKTANQLGIKVYERELIRLACEYGELSEKAMSAADEKATNPYLFQTVHEGIDLLEQHHDLQRTRRVEVAGRLVGDDDAGVVDQCAGDGHTLLLAAGQLVRQPPALVLQPHQLQHVGHALFDLLFRRADDAHRERDVVIDGLVLDQAEILKDDAERPAQIGDGAAADLLELKAIDVHAALRRGQLRRQQLDDRRLAGP